MRSIILLCITCSFCACRSSRHLPSVYERTDSIYVEKLVPVMLPEDSASIQALLECDKNGKVILRQLDMSNTQNVRLLFRLDSLGNLLTKMKVPPDTLYLPSKEKLVYKDKIVRDTQSVEKKLRWWEQLFLHSGKVFWGAFILYILYKYLKKRFRL